MSFFQKELNILNTAESQLIEAVHEEFPTGSEIIWLYRGYQQYGTVVGYSRNDPRLLVKNYRTEKNSWISPDQIEGRPAEGHSFTMN